MKKNLMMTIVMVVAGMFLVACAVSPIAGVAPGLKTNVIKMPSSSNPVVTSVKLDQKAVIEQFILEADKAWHKGDVEVFLMCYSEDAQIMVGREKKIVSKEEYRKMLPSTLERLGSTRQGSIKITLINKSSATVERVSTIYIRNHEVTLYKTLDLICHKGRWLIQRSVHE